MPVVNSSMVPASVQSIAAGATYDIRPAEGEEIVLHYVLHSGNGKVNIYDGSTLGPALGSSSTGNCVKGEAYRLTYGMYARFTSLEASAAQTLTYSAVYAVVPA